MIVIVGCGRAKQSAPTAAGHLYRGSYAACALRWARSVAPPGDIYILSAKYGLVPHDRVIAPYEMTLRDPGAVTAERLRVQAEALGLLGYADVVVVAGKSYVALARTVWPGVRAPFAAVGVMGRQIYAMTIRRGQVPV